jgi:hypothetical protein
VGFFSRALDWEWELPSGAHLKATLDVGKRTESIWFDKRLVSRARIGAKAGGHTVPLPAGGPYRGEEARVRFDADLRTCTFTIGDNALPPTLFPGKALPSRSLDQWGFLGLGLAVLLVVSGVAVVWARVGAARGAAAEIDNDAPLALSFASPDGLLVAHFPTGFGAAVADPDDDMPGAVKITRPAIGTVIGFMSLREGGSAGAERLTHVLPNGFGPETSHTSGACFGEPGVIVERRLTNGPVGTRSWSCTFVHNGHGYSFFYSLPANASAAREALIRRIVDGTELTGEPPPPPVVVASKRPDNRGDQGFAGPSFRIPTAVPTTRTTSPPPPPPTVRRPPSPPPLPRPPPRTSDPIVCDESGACFGSKRR